ncbi:MAG: DNA metabolism protein [Eggerthellaceae bacterium]|nr:DNA metabolism protein [Eggerthellaceae bacterium]
MSTPRRAAPHPDGPPPEVYDELAYLYDGTLEGLFSAIFASYERHEDPTDVLAARDLQVRLGQHAVFIDTDLGHAERVRAGFRHACGPRALSYAKRAALSDEPGAATAVYRYVRHGMTLNARRNCASCARRGRCDGARNPAGRPGAAPCPKVRGSLMSDLSHPVVGPVFGLARSVSTEQEHLLQFIRFEHLEGGLWYARCNPKANVVPLVMDHFASRFNTQPFIIYDEVHHMAGVYEGRGWTLARTDADSPELSLPDRAADEATMQRAWRRFYHAVSVESRYNPELRRHLMPKRFWRNLTEMQEEPPGLARTGS